MTGARLQAPGGPLAPLPSPCPSTEPHRKWPPSNLRARVKATVLAGMLRPVEKVSVANRTWGAGGGGRAQVATKLNPKF